MSERLQVAEDRLAQASDWFARLGAGAELADDEALAFDAWLDADPANTEAFDAVTATAEAYEAAAPQVLAGLELESVRRAKRLATGKPAFGRRGFLAMGGLAAAAAAAFIITPSLLPSPTEIYSTGVGEKRTVTLSDGSTVDLNAQTRMTVSFRHGERRVSLPEGEAIFDVAKDADRPFTIDAGRYAVRVVGTQFDVRNRPEGLSVAVSRGIVEVRPTAEPGARVFRLHHGQRFKVALQGQPELSQVDPGEAFAWRAGRMIYRSEPLSAVVADLNREFHQPIRISDARLKDMPITGVLVLDNQADVVHRLTLMLPVSAVPSEQGVLLRAR
ncbi:FecR family protein [Phenylobacterium immobile]|uniref:FecR family protein n=1 Tax=Phenylobacterium immobile TaxID=21 RepID=UPI000A850295|nr:FecR domain-containing protein [Phenylobacterium immobile]